MLIAITQTKIGQFSQAFHDFHRNRYSQEKLTPIENITEKFILSLNVFQQLSNKNMNENRNHNKTKTQSILNNFFLTINNF